MTKTKRQIIDPLSQDGQILAQITQALYNKEPLSGPGGIITKLLKQAMESTLQGELEHHLADNQLDSTNRRNGLDEMVIILKL